MISVAIIIDINGRRLLLHFITEGSEKITADSIKLLSTPCKSNCVSVRRTL
jgi:hypothetical protein